MSPISIPTLVLAAAVFALCAAAPGLLPDDVLASRPWLAQATIKLLMAGAAVGLALASRQPLASFGFRRPRGLAPGAIVLGLLLGAAATLTILGSGLPGLRPLLAGYPFLAIVLWIWLVSSVAEELFVRGWLQTRVTGDAASRQAVAASALFFGAMHVPLLLRVDVASTAVIVAFTTALGWVTARARARTGSLLPPILAHIGFNVGGVFGGIAFEIGRRLLR